MACSSCKKNKEVSAAISLSSSIAKVISHAVVHGGEIVAEETLAGERLTICNACAEKVGKKCRVCKCFVKAKTALAAESCPRKKW